MLVQLIFSRVHTWLTEFDVLLTFLVDLLGYFV